MLDSTVNNIGQLPCASASDLRYTASVLASVSNPAASVLVSVSASSALVTTLDSRIGISRSADQMVLLLVGPNTRWRPEFRTAISLQRIIRSTSCLVLGRGLRDRQIKWRYLQLEQIQDVSRPPCWQISNCHISATVHPIHSVFGSRVNV